MKARARTCALVSGVGLTGLTLMPVAVAQPQAGPIQDPPGLGTAQDGRRPATPEPVLAATPNQPLTFTVGDNVQVADVTRDGLADANISLRVFPGRLRGHIGTDPVNLRLEPRRVVGTLGDHPVGLDVIRSGRALDVEGTFGARSVAMQIRREGIGAQIGPCDYDLRFVLGHYRGSVTCGGSPVPVDLVPSVALIARDDRELAAMLTALLAR